MGTAHEMIWDFETISATKTRGVRQSVTTIRTDWLIPTSRPLSPFGIFRSGFCTAVPLKFQPLTLGYCWISYRRTANDCPAMAVASWQAHSFPQAAQHPENHLA